MNQIHEFALRYRCEYCEAAPAQWCRTRPSGGRASYMHADRFNPVQQANAHGWAEGQNEILDAYIEGPSPYFERHVHWRKEELAAL